MKDNGNLSGGIRAVTLDGFGTLLALDRPYERLTNVLAGEGLAVPLEAVRTAFLAEMTYYRDHHLIARDADSLNAFRRCCAGRLFGELSAMGYAVPLPAEQQVALLLQAVRFRLFDDVLPALASLKEAGFQVGIVSNWDFSLPETLAALGLDTRRFDVVTVSAAMGLAKPAPGIFEATARAFGLGPASVLHVGDEWETDFRAAESAGLRAAFLQREPGIRQPGLTIRRLTELPALLQGG